MNDPDIETIPRNTQRASEGRTGGWFAAGGVVGALLASTCCIVPLVLVLLGISGVWIGALTAFEPYKPLFAVMALTFIGFGFKQVYFTSKPACAEESQCARPQSARIAKTALWISTGLVILALTINWWAPVFY